MKRLLAYLFIVLGLTILFQSKSFASIKLLASGCIEGNCINGQGTYIWPWGEEYVGEFKDGKKHGQGTFTWTDGDKYVGEFKDDLKHGQGTYTMANGTVGKGIWENDELVEPN